MSPKLSRRSALRFVVVAIFAVPIKFFRDMVHARMAYLAQTRAQIELSMDVPLGISFHGDVIVLRQPDRYLVLSARCPHLGCRVDRAVGSELVCPCHGSRFSFTGERRRGPARRGLSQLKFQIRAQERKLIVEPPI